MATIPWTPASLNTALWLDASDAGTITVEGAGVSSWRDKSGNGNNVTQSDPAIQPVVTSGALNGLDVITFDGTEFLGNYVSFPIRDMAIFTVYKRNGYDNYAGISSARGTGTEDYTSNDAYVFYTDYATEAEGGGFQINTNTFMREPNPSVLYVPKLIGVNLSSGTTASLRKNGTQVATGTIPAGALDNTAGEWRVGGRNTTGNNLIGYVAEFIIVQKSPTVNDMELIEGYLAHKWGLEGDLPAGHTYKAAAPTLSVDIEAELNMGYAVDASLGAKSAVLPGTPEQYDKVGFADYAGAFAYNALRVYPNDKPINSSNVPIVLSGTGGSIELTFFDDTTGWMVTG